MFHGTRRSARRRLLTLEVLLLAAAAFGAIFAVAQSHEADRAISSLTLTSYALGVLDISWNAPSRTPTVYRVNWARADESYPS